MNRDLNGYALDLAGIALLSDLVAQHGVEQVWLGVRDVLGFPPAMISTVAEVEQVADYLQPRK